MYLLCGVGDINDMLQHNHVPLTRLCTGGGGYGYKEVG